MTNSIPPEPCRRLSGEMGVSGGIFLPRPSPVTSSKRPTPLAYFLLTRETRGTLWQDGEPRGGATTAPTPANGTDVTVRSQPEGHVE
jgi:hypothetical protein